jgi:4-pyridoxate dehydrogenase
MRTGSPMSCAGMFCAMSHASSTPYLDPVRRRPNLTVVTGALAHRVTFAGLQANGVEYAHGNALHRVAAEREVLLCGGTFNTSQLLMLSGIGSADHLIGMGIAPLADLAVGDNLHDHLTVALFWKRLQRSAFHGVMRFDRAAISMVRAKLFGTGPGTVVPFGLHAFVKTSPELDVPDIEFMFRGAPLGADTWFPGFKPPYEDGFGILPAVLHPKSRGTIRLRSSDPSDPMRIAFNFLSAPEDLDKLRQGFMLCRELAQQAPMDAFRGAEIRPGPDMRTPSEVDAWIRSTAHTVSHPVSTCRMGSDPDAVVDTCLRVRGVGGLACRRCLGDAGHHQRAHQRVRDHDGRKGF